MGTTIELTAADGHKFKAYRAEPSGKPRGGLVVAMEIFGVNSHIRSVADGYAADGYRVIAPALFDRIERDYETGYSQEEIERGIAIIQAINLDDTVKDVAAALQNISDAGKAGMVGYCWGGRVCWKSAADVAGLSCSIPYYGGGIPGMADLKPNCPVMFHWGESDASIPMDDVKVFAEKHNDQTHHYYKAGHGFNCDQRGSYDADSAKLARSRSLAFLGEHVG